jgi:anti-sigma B factor antagonist
MSTPAQGLASPASLALGPDLTIAHAAAWRQTLLQALAAHSGDLALDLSAVTDIDSAGLQLLLSTRRSLLERGDGLHIAASSAALDDALGHFGLADLLAGPAGLQ